MVVVSGGVPFIALNQSDVRLLQLRQLAAHIQRDRHVPAVGLEIAAQDGIAKGIAVAGIDRIAHHFQIAPVHVFNHGAGQADLRGIVFAGVPGNPFLLEIFDRLIRDGVIVGLGHGVERVAGIIFETALAQLVIAQPAAQTLIVGLPLAGDGPGTELEAESPVVGVGAGLARADAEAAVRCGADRPLEGAFETSYDRMTTDFTVLNSVDSQIDSMTFDLIIGVD